MGSKFIFNNAIYFGVKTGCNKAFIIDNETKEALIRQDPKSSEIIKPLLRGKDIGRYRSQWKGFWLINSHNGYGETLPVDIDNYKAVKKHLENFYPELEKRWDKGNTPYNLRNCAYYEEFERDKIVWSDISTEPTFHVLERGMYINNTAYMIVGEDLKYLLGVLNSSLIAFCLPMITTGLGKKGSRYFKQFVEKLPVPETDESTSSSSIVQFVDEIISHKNDGKNTDSLEAEVDCLVYELYRLTPEEISLIESNRGK